MKKTSFVVAILASALLAGACHKKKDTNSPATGTGSAMGSDMGSGSAAGSGDMGSAAGSAAGSGGGM